MLSKVESLMWAFSSGIGTAALKSSAAWSLSKIHRKSCLAWSHCSSICETNCISKCQTIKNTPLLSLDLGITHLVIDGRKLICVQFLEVRGQILVW